MTRRLLPMALAAWMIVAGTSLGQVASSFDSGTEGWLIRDANCSDYALTIASFAPTWQPAGGDPGGWVRHQDTTSFCSFFAAPAAYLGDQSAYLGGAIEFSLASTHTSWQESDVVVLLGAGLVLCHELPVMPPPPPAWGHYVVPLQAAGFTYDDENGAPVSTADFAAVLADLEGLLLPAEFGAQVEEVVGLDSVRLYQPGTPVGDGPPVAYHLGARPNPFNPVTTITFDLPDAQPVRLTVHDARGRLICTLRDGQVAGAGRHEATWRGRNNHGATQPSGAYVIRLEAGTSVATTRVLLLK